MFWQRHGRGGKALLSRSISAFLQESPQLLAEKLAFEDIQHHRINEAKQLLAWLETVALLQAAFAN